MPTESNSPGLEMGGRSFTRLKGVRCFLLFTNFFIFETPLASRIPLRVEGSERSHALMSITSSPSITPARGCLSFRNITRCIGPPGSGGDLEVGGAGVARQAIAERAQL